MNQNKIKTKVYAGITILLWSTTFIFTKEGLKYYNAETLAVIRYFFSAIGLLILIFTKKMKIPDFIDIPIFIVLGFLGFAFYIITFNRGMITLNSSTSSVLLACSPIIAAIFARIFLKEKISLYGWLAIFFSFSGIIILTLWEGIFKFNNGIYWILLSSVLIAAYNVILRGFSNKYGGLEITVYSMLAGSVMLILYFPKSVYEIKFLNIYSFSIIVWLSLFGTVIAYIFWSMALEISETTGEVTNFMFITPFLATILGIIFLGEKITIPTIMGGVLILSGIVAYNKYK